MFARFGRKILFFLFFLSVFAAVTPFPVFAQSYPGAPGTGSTNYLLGDVNVPGVGDIGSTIEQVQQAIEVPPAPGQVVQGNKENPPVTKLHVVWIGRQSSDLMR